MQSSRPIESAKGFPILVWHGMGKKTRFDDGQVGVQTVGEISHLHICDHNCTTAPVPVHALPTHPIAHTTCGGGVGWEMTSFGRRPPSDRPLWTCNFRGLVKNTPFKRGFCCRKRPAATGRAQPDEVLRLHKPYGSVPSRHNLVWWGFDF